MCVCACAVDKSGWHHLTAGCDNEQLSPVWNTAGQKHGVIVASVASLYIFCHAAPVLWSKLISGKQNLRIKNKTPFDIFMKICFHYFNVCVCTCACAQGPAEAIRVRFLRARVISSCGTPNMDTRNQTWILCGSNKAFL